MKQLVVKIICCLAFLIFIGWAIWCSTDRHFYNIMCKMPVESTWCMGDSIPAPLSGLKETYKGPILSFRKDTVSITQRFPNLFDEKNRYLIYILKDNHNHSWSLVREPDRKYKYYLYRDE